MSAQTTTVVCASDVQTTGCARRCQAELQTTDQGALSDREQAQTTALVCACAWMGLRLHVTGARAAAHPLGQPQTTALVCTCAWSGLRSHVTGARVAVCTSRQPQTTALLFLKLDQGMDGGIGTHPFIASKVTLRRTKGVAPTHPVGARPFAHQLCSPSPPWPELVERRRSADRELERRGCAPNWCTAIRAPTLPPDERGGS